MGGAAGTAPASQYGERHVSLRLVVETIIP
jgi:hypothetical protein